MKFPNILILTAAGVLACFCGQATAQDHPAYVGSDTCADCHVDETAAWKGSHHDQAWMMPTPDSILGDFGGTEFEHNGMNSRVFREDGAYKIEVTEIDGSQNIYDVHSVAGIAPLQQYLLEIEPGKLQSFDVAWDTEENRWYNLYPDMTLAPKDGLHWTGGYKSWNARCAECHATGFEKNYDATTKQYASTQAEIGVGCEACHGPGQAHLAWADSATYDADMWPDLGPSGLSIAFSAGDAEVEIQQCASCHSRREAYGDGNPLPGTPFHDAYRLSGLRQNLYHADGTIEDEVYVYGSFLQSKMYNEGVQCSDCHDVHKATLKAEDNSLCTQCHSQGGNSRFESLTLKDYDTPDHYFHDAGSPASECKSCHMVERTYMGVDARSDHSFRVPRPDLSVTTGAPNTCNDCHTDKTAAWAASELATRFPDSANRGPHFASVFSAARANPDRQINALVGVAEEASLPGIVRASALDLLKPVSGPVIADRLAPLISDPDPLVRVAAIGVQRGASPQDRVIRIVPALADPLKAVRIAAAREMVDAPIARMPKKITADFNQAMSEWHGAMQAKRDFPEAHLVIGGAALAVRNVPAALQAFGAATELDPQLVQAWRMQARILAAIGQMPEARDILRQGLAANPVDPLLMQTADELQ